MVAAIAVLSSQAKVIIYVIVRVFLVVTKKTAKNSDSGFDS